LEPPREIVISIPLGELNEGFISLIAFPNQKKKLKIKASKK